MLDSPIEKLVPIIPKCRRWCVSVRSAESSLRRTSLKYVSFPCLTNSNTPVRAMELFIQPPNPFLDLHPVKISYSQIHFSTLALLSSSQYVLQGDENTGDQETTTKVFSPNDGDTGTAHRAASSVYSSGIIEPNEWRIVQRGTRHVKSSSSMEDCTDCSIEWRTIQTVLCCLFEQFKSVIYPFSVIALSEKSLHHTSGKEIMGMNLAVHSETFR